MTHPDEIDLVPERNFWERSHPVLFIVPRPLKRYFIEISRKFGVEVANLVLLAYNEWGKDAALYMARVILSFDSYDELINFLLERARKLGTGREIVASLVYSYRFSREFQRLLEEKRNVACPQAADEMTRIFHLLASHGVFYEARCIRVVAEKTVGCREKVPSKCARAYNAYLRISGGE